MCFVLSSVSNRFNVFNRFNGLFYFRSFRPDNIRPLLRIHAQHLYVFNKTDITFEMRSYGFCILNIIMTKNN